MNISISAPALVTIQDGFKRAPSMVQRELLAAATEASMLLEREVKDAMPAVSGLTRASVTSDAFSTPAGVLGVVGSAQVAAVALELGTKPHMPPVKALVPWVIEALGVEPKRAERVAFLVARKIARVGTKAQKPFEKSLGVTQPQIVRMFEAAAGRIAAQLGGAA